MPLQLFPPQPPVDGVAITTRELIAGGHLLQRELVDSSGLGRLARDRSLSAPDVATLERWDAQATFSPLAFATGDGPLTSWRTTEPYPTDGLHFRDEHPFVSWDELTAQVWGHRYARPLYSPWQVMYLGQARQFDGIEVFADAMLERGERLAEWAQEHASFVEQHVRWRDGWHGSWLPMIKVLIRLQSRYWPFVTGKSLQLIDTTTHEYVDALDLEYERSRASDVIGDLGLATSDVHDAYRWLAWRWRAVDPVPDLYPLLRMEPRRRRERRQGVVLQSLDLQDAATMTRRFLHELEGELPPDLDQIDDPDVAPRSLRRDRGQLQAALRTAGLYPHRLHIVVEGATEQRLIKRLFSAFHGPWEGSGLALTDLQGDKLNGSRTMLEGFSIYADAVALLLDDENQARRITEHLARSGVLVGDHVKLWDRSLEEDNFTPTELLAMVADIGRASEAELLLTEEELIAEQNRVDARPGPRQALASTLQRLARRPEHGSVVYSKPDLAEPMADLIIDEIRRAPGRHDEVAVRRPIVAWMLAYPVRAARN